MKRLVFVIALVLLLSVALLSSCTLNKERVKELAHEGREKVMDALGEKAVEAFQNGDFEAAYEYCKNAEFLSDADKNLITEKYITEVLLEQGKYDSAAELLGKSELTQEVKDKICESYPGLEDYLDKK